MALSLRKCVKGSRARGCRCFNSCKGRGLAPELLSALKWSRKVRRSSSGVINWSAAEESGW